MKRAGLVVVVVSGLVVACGSLPATIDGGPDASPTDGKADRAPVDVYVPTCAEVKACDGPPPSVGADCVVSFDTTLVDMAGAPVTAEDVFLCGTNICTSALSPDAQGKVHELVCQYFVQGAAKYIGGIRYASFTAAVPAGPAVTVAPLTLVPLPAMGVDIPLGGGDATSAGVTLTVATGSVTFDPTEPDDADLHRFRAVQVPIGKAPPAIPANIEVVWGLGPVNAALKPAAKLTVPNTAAWPANATVLFTLNGVDAFDVSPPVPYASWGAIGVGHVSADGTTVSTDPGQGNGIPMLGMVGIRKM